MPIKIWSMNKISIVGAGNTGATIAYTLAIHGYASEIVLIDIHEEKAQGEAEAKLKAAEAEIQIAKAQAEAKIAKAQGEADAQLKIAQAEATALKLKSIEIARALGFTVKEAVLDNADGTQSIEYEIDFEGKSVEEIKLITDYLKYIEYLSKWDGKLPSVMTENGANVVIPTNPID